MIGHLHELLWFPENPARISNKQSQIHSTNNNLQAINFEKNYF